MARHPLLTALDIQEECSKELDEAIIEEYRRTGDIKLRDQIIQANVRLAIGMAGRYAKWWNRRAWMDLETQFNELASVALLALTQAVVWAGEGRLNDNNIVPYLKATIQGRMRKQIEEDRLVRVPGRTYRRKVAEGEFENLTFSAHRLDDEEHELVARREEPELEFTEALELAILTPEQRRVIDLRAEGYKYREIGQILGISPPSVGRIIEPVEDRFRKLYA